MVHYYLLSCSQLTRALFANNKRSRIVEWDFSNPHEPFKVITPFKTTKICTLMHFGNISTIQKVMFKG